MLKDKKWYISIVTLTASLVILFGSWFIYQEMNIKAPIKESISSIKGVKVNKVNIDRENINLFVTLEKELQFQITYEKIEKNIEPYLKNRKLKINISNDTSDSLQQAWNKSYFAIAEAIDRQEYSLIPETIESLKQKNRLDKADYTMDEENIYIDLHKGNSSLYLVIPREKETEVKNLG